MLCSDQQVLAMTSDTRLVRLACANIIGRMAGWTFETFPHHPGAEAALEGAHAYAATNKPDPPGILFVGPTGVGKTGLAVAIAQARIAVSDGGESTWNYLASDRIVEQYRKGELRRRPTPVYFEPWASMKSRWRQDERRKVQENEDDGTLLDELDRWCTLLILDEVGIGQFSPWAEELLLSLLSRVERGRRLIVTANREPAELIEVIGERAADRLTDPDMFRIVAVMGASLRQRKVGPKR